MKNVLLIGLGRFGRHVCMELYKLGHQVMAVDSDEERVNACMDYVANAMIGDSTRPEFLKTLGVGNYDLCFVTIGGDFQDSLETTALLKELGAKFVVARAERDVQAKFLLRNGADEVTYLERQMAKWAAIRYTANHLLKYIELDDTHAVVEVVIPEAWHNKSIGELGIRNNYGINVLGIVHHGETDLSVTAETRLNGEDTILVLGRYDTLQECFDL